MVHTDGFEADNNFQRIESGTDSEGEPEDVHVRGIVSFRASQRYMQILHIAATLYQLCGKMPTAIKLY